MTRRIFFIWIYWFMFFAIVLPMIVILLVSCITSPPQEWRVTPGTLTYTATIPRTVDRTSVTRVTIPLYSPTATITRTATSTLTVSSDIGRAHLPSVTPTRTVTRTPTPCPSINPLPCYPTPTRRGVVK